MTLESWLQIALALLLGLLISVPAGRYLARVVRDERTWLDPVLDPPDNLIYRLIGTRLCRQPMNWKTYTLHMLATNLGMALLIYLILVFQAYLPLNPQHFAGVEPMLAFNTAVSFITNTDWQAYGGETTLSNLSQMAAITFPMFTSATTGFVVAMAFIRAFTVKDGGANLGNFYRDLIRFTTRVLMPVSFVLALLMIQQGEPQTLAASVTAHPLPGGEQTIALGPVASMETIKHLGTNGGGFFNANAAHPFENPTPITNLVQTLLMIALPSSIVVCFGIMIGNRRQAWLLYGVMAALLMLFLPMVVVPEQAGTPLLAKVGIDLAPSDLQPGGNMEGKEVRFGIAQSGLFSSITTTFTTGSVNSMLDSYTPIGGMGALIGMMLQCVFGGKGVGFLAALVFGIIGVFIAGLMVGRTPEFLGKKIEKPEIVLVALTLLIHPLVILAPTGWSVISSYGVEPMGNAGIHGYSEVLYAFTTSAANNGSAFAGLNGNTPWYNLALGTVILLGRYPPIIFMMALAGSIAAKPTLAPSVGTVRTDTLKFGLFWFGTILVVGALTFFPALVLGPIAEFVALKAGLTF
ncbi:MAG: potassium-transporting ATPase subunit KdpA [Alphaproteobacteria bacterium]|nr:potassium-transporting ATPase subunit KdpA [Alphaproteobacteria bacterium]